MSRCELRASRGLKIGQRGITLCQPGLWAVSSYVTPGWVFTRSRFIRLDGDKVRRSAFPIWMQFAGPR